MFATIMLTWDGSDVARNALDVAEDRFRAAPTPVLVVGERTRG